MRKISSLLFFVVSLVFEPLGNAADPAVIDYQKIADGAGWNWIEDFTSPFHGIKQAGSKYDIVIVSEHQNRWGLTFKILHEGKEVYAWKGHQHTVFRIMKDRLYYARFGPESSGTSIVAVDLNSGRELWKTSLFGVGSPDHSKYRNRMNLDATSEAVFVYGDESAGRYFEIKDATTGKTVGHKVFPKPESNPSAAR